MTTASDASAAAGEGDDDDRLELTAAAGDDGARLDRFLADNIPGLSRSRLQALIQDGHVARGGHVVTGAATSVRPGDAFLVTIPLPEDAIPVAEDIPIRIVYEDDQLLIVDKPAGLVVHPAHGHPRGTLVNALLYHCRGRLSGISGVRRPGIVHRLDKETSGLMVVAKTDRAHHHLSHQLQSRRLSRGYQAVVWDVPTPAQGRIDAPIGRHPRERTSMAVVPDGKPAATNYTVLRRFHPGAGVALASLVQCKLESGRTHQIRVHLSHIGHPLIGDPLYGRRRNPARRRDLAHLPPALIESLAAFPRQALHACHLEMEHPTTGAPLTADSPLASDIKALISLLE